MIFYFSRGFDNETDATATSSTAEEQTAENGDGQGGEAGDTTESEESGTDSESTTDSGTETDSSSLATEAQSFLDDLIASNERMEALIAECDSDGIAQEVQTFRVAYEATTAFISANTGNPQALEELPDFPD